MLQIYVLKYELDIITLLRFNKIHMVSQCHTVETICSYHNLQSSHNLPRSHNLLMSHYLQPHQDKPWRVCPLDMSPRCPQSAGLFVHHCMQRMSDHHQLKLNKTALKHLYFVFQILTVNEYNQILVYNKTLYVYMYTSGADFFIAVLQALLCASDAVLL